MTDASGPPLEQVRTVGAVTISRIAWYVTIDSSLAWSTLVTLHFISNSFRSGICGAGLLEVPQLLFIVFGWLPTNLFSFASSMRSQDSRRKVAYIELFTIAFAAFALWEQFQWEPGCSAYM